MFTSVGTNLENIQLCAFRTICSAVKGLHAILFSNKAVSLLSKTTVTQITHDLCRSVFRTFVLSLPFLIVAHFYVNHQLLCFILLVIICI